MTLAAAAAVVVVIAAAPATAQDPCGVPAAPSWTPTETTVWQQLCAGQWADLNRPGETLDPNQPDDWDDARVVSSAFVEQLLTQPYAAAIDRHGIRLRGAWLPNGLDVHETTMSFPLRCQACRIARLQADDTVIDGTLDLSGSAVEGDLSLLGADIRADLIVSGGSVVSGTLNADRLTVAGDVFLRDGSKFNDIDLLGVDIGGNLELDRGSVVSGTLDADRLTVAGNVFLNEGSKFNNIDLSGADIGGLVYLAGAKWEPSGSLDLRQARAGGVWTDDRADSWPATIRLNGFEFEQWANPDPRTLGSDWFTGTWLARLDAFSPGPYNQLAAVMDAAGHPTIAADVRYHRSHAERGEVGWRRPEGWGRALHWLVLGYGFRPWWAAGWFLAAWAIGYLVFAFRVRLQPDPAPDDTADGPRPGRLRRWRARVATVGRIRLGKAEQWSAGQAALYSLDRLLPAFKLVDPDQFPARTRAQQAWSVVQMLLGWLLTLFIVGWLGSLLVQP